MILIGREVGRLLMLRQGLCMFIGYTYSLSDYT